MIRIALITLTRSVYTAFSGLNVPFLDDKNIPFLLYRKGVIFLMGVLSSVFRKKKGRIRVPFLYLLGVFQKKHF
jgi:hypothetical protein